MMRKAFKMKLKAGYEEEYKKRHDAIWGELKEELSKAGVYDYTIYLDEETLTLFAFQKLREDNRAAELPNNPVVRKWWDYMKDLMEYNEKGEPVTVELREVFHMD